MTSEAFDLSSTYVHLGPGPSVVPLPDFRWDAEYLEAYTRAHGADGDEGRLVMIGPNQATWSSWERHPAGPELVVLLSGRVTLVQDLDGEHHRIELRAGEAVVNPKGVWHTVDVHERGECLYITPGRGTEHRSR